MTENGFMKHKCKGRERLDALKSVQGFAAYGWYEEWMKRQRRSVPSREVFASSRQFLAFMNFVDWVKRVAIPHPEMFIQLMIDTGTPPVLWCRNTTYEAYLEWYDKAYPPEEQFVSSCVFLKGLIKEASTENIYQELGASFIVNAVKKRKLSPWLLTLSPKFLSWVRTLDESERQAIAEVVNFRAFANKISERPDLAAAFKHVCGTENF
jgi:hypothetical protein